MTTQLELFGERLPLATDSVIDWDSLSGVDIAALDDAAFRRYRAESAEPEERRLRLGMALRRARAHRATRGPAPLPDPVCEICRTQYGGRSCDRCG